MFSTECHKKQAILLSQATECLAKAAIALSEAAEAIAAAAKSFVPDTTSATVLPSQPPETTETNNAIGAIVDYESDSDSSPTTEKFVTPTRNTNNARGEQQPDSKVTTAIPGGNSTTDAGDEDYLAVQSTWWATPNDGAVTATTQPTTTNDAPEPEIAIQPLSPSYRILLDDEAEVLLAACSLIRKGRKKVICYVRSSITALEVYEAVLSATQVPVHRIKSSSLQELERLEKAFQLGQRSVLLLPATHAPAFRINEPDSWVIHVGWPTNEELYKQQLIHHQAKNNVFIAYSEDQDIYPSSLGILELAQPWPHQELLKEDCQSFRPAFNKKLAEIPIKVKAKVYPDWITLHGMRGPYHPPSWTPITLVYRANLYLLDVFRYNVPNSTQIALPTVSAGFVTSQNLESAVEEGVLLVKSTSSQNHISSLPHDAIPAGTLSLNEAESSKPPGNFGPQSAPAPASHLYGSWGIGPEITSGSLNPSIVTQTPPRSVSRISSIAGSDRNLNKRTDRVTEYLIIEKDFDVIPSVCHLAMQPNCKNVICFVKALVVFEPLASMIGKVVAKPVFSIRGSGALSKIVKDALDSSTGCLILCDMHSERPQPLTQKPIDLTIHLGWVDNPAMYQNQIRQNSNIVVLLRREVQAPHGSEVVASLGRAGVAPASVATKRNYNRQTEDSITTPARKQWVAVLSLGAAIQSLRSAYIAWIAYHYQGRHKVPEWTAVDVVTHANRYFKGLFRCANEAGALQARPVVLKGFVQHHSLEAAVAAGLLTVKS
ncbi:hypothetical protein RSOLAG22IIIB_09317 [Rhizoctonia solani]|uniref:Uncharacterized protein n=1 Tax=Rhizoctonia solani TaxID=456999 RepID=A0A0K6FY86_9AGAM|nr:hypothetical protein RSOLAG22IIIB_09317 [Rhizoctonia solani]